MHPIVDVETAPPQRAAVPFPKVRVPRATATLVLRPRLLDLLGTWGDEGTTGPDLTFLCAPAGSGKTTLLAEWARRRRHRGDAAVAWVSLDSGDNDIYGFWSVVLAAIDESTRAAGGSPVGVLSAPARGFSPAFLSAFVDAISASGRPIYLVLDNAQELHDPETVHSLDMVLRSLPARLKVVISARFMPPLALPRLRLEGRVLDIDGTRLAFTAAEATTLFGGHGVQLPEEDLLALLQRTEGWAAGLRLAAMSLAHAEDPSALIASFVGDDRAVADYLVGEVLVRLEEPTRQFLLTTSVSERITADLARELSGREDAGAVLDDLERSNSFVVRLGPRGDWYGYHPLLRQYLRAELARQSHEHPAALHRRAADWFADRGETMTAIEHAVEAKDADLTAALLESHGLQHILRGEGTRLRRVLVRACSETVRRPGVALIIAATALDAGDPAAADAALDLMCSSGSEAPPPVSPRLRSLHAFIALQRARFCGDQHAAREILTPAPAPTGDADLDLLILVHRGTTWAWLGDVDAAESDLRHALLAARGTGANWVALQCLAQLSAVACARSDMSAARSVADEAIGCAAAHGWTRSLPHATAALSLGWAAYQRLDDDHVDHLAPSVRILADSPEPSTALAAAIFQAVVAFDRTENRHALVAAIRAAWQRPAGHLPPPLVAGAALIEQRMALQVGEPLWAEDVVERTERLLGGAGELQVLQAVAHAHRGRTYTARRLLAPVLAGQVDCVVPLTRLEAWIWEARLADRAGEETPARRAVGEALTIGVERELLRPFVAGGRELHDLLARDAGRFGPLDAFAARVRAATAPPAGQENLELLTTRELQLLVELPSLRTAEEIGATMFVSVNTVRTHLRGIYRKLGVGNRREAIILARRRGLL